MTALQPITNDWPTRRQLDALARLWAHAQGRSGQCRFTAAFLLGLYNGSRFRFDLTSLRALDPPLFEDCLEVLRMDNSPRREVHDVLRVSGSRFEQLARDWRIADVEQLEAIARGETHANDLSL